MPSYPRPRALAAVLVLLALAAACGENDAHPSTAAAAESTKARLQQAARAAAVLARAEFWRDSLAATRQARFAEGDPLHLTLAELSRGPHVLIRNPTARTGLRLLVEDAGETHPLSQVLALADSSLTLAARTRDRPGSTLVQLARGPLGEPRPGAYEGRLVVLDTGGVQTEREVRVTVPEPLPQAAAVESDTVWTAAIYKLAALPPLRRMLDNAEARCSRDNRARTGLAATRLAAWGRGVVGTCIRDNTIPLAGAITSVPAGAAGAGPDSSAKAGAPDGVIRLRQPQVLLGVVNAEDGGDQGLVWWTGDSLSVGGTRAGVELQFTSLDHPGDYFGKIDLARAGAAGVVGLRVRVTHDWPLALAAIFVGVYLSRWLRNYVRTRRAVLRMQETAAGLVARIAAANEQFQSVESDVPGYQAYSVDEKLLAGLRKVERQLEQHAYDGTVLEPGTAEHDTLRKQLEEAEVNVALWEELASILGELRPALATAHELRPKLRSEAEMPVLLAEAERLFDGTSLDTAAVAELDARATRTEEGVRCWKDVAFNALTLQHRLVVATADDHGRDAAAGALAAAVESLWAAGTAVAVKEVGSAVAAAAALYQPRRKVLKIFGAETDPPPVPPSADLRESAAAAAAAPPHGSASPPVSGAPAPAREAARDALLLREDEARRSRREGERRLRQRAMQLREAAESRRKADDRKYLAITLVVAAATGLNQLYFKAGGFGDMQDYMVALLWGFGTKMGFDTVRTAVEAGRLPWLPRKNAGDAAAPAPAAPAPAAPAPEPSAAHKASEAAAAG